MKKQHRKCSGVDLTFFDPVGAFPKSGGDPNHPCMKHFGKSKSSMKTSLVDQSLRAVHPGGVEKCCIFCPEKKKSKMTPHGPFSILAGKRGSGRRIKCPIGQSKHLKSTNPTLQPCWVHPTKSQNSLQEIDAQPNTKLKWPYFGAKQIMAPKKGGKMGHFGAFF